MRVIPFDLYILAVGDRGDDRLLAAGGASSLCLCHLCGEGVMRARQRKSDRGQR